MTLASTRLSKGFGDGQPVAASRYHTRSRFLPAGVAPERGLQVRTILTARSISAEFPQIHEIGGVRPDPLPWRPLGMAIDVMIPDPESAQGIALGNAIVAYVLQNADRFGIQDAIWRGVYYTPNGAQTSRLGHYDHVHVTTIGGGYPTGDEVYLR
ncbi:glycoside hydrolase [Mycobacterium avium subsp. silvaticum ATCC 49884]|nr:glycoside hydrolase [Mycobacterium avium subsp. silvaticum ATCC 49884]